MLRIPLRPIGPQFLHDLFQKSISNDQRLYRIACVNPASRDGLVGGGFEPVGVGLWDFGPAL